jgi:polysaccharide biosynthesis transport protein
MNLISFLRLIRKHLILLLLIPLLMALLVLYLTRKPDYKFASETTLYTGIASGSSVEMDKSLSFFATNTAFDNLINIIKSRETQQEVGIRLLAQHLMMKTYDPKYISRESFINLHEITPSYILKLIDKDIAIKTTAADTSNVTDKFSFDSLDTTKVIQPVSINPVNFERTVKNLETYMASSDTNFVYKLLNFNHPHYSIKAISSVTAKRIGTSDLVKLQFESDDPGICKQTLVMLTEVCTKNYKITKENRSDVVVKYFEYQLKQSAKRLKVGEDELLKFNEDHNIINYYEQSKAVAIVKENLDVSYHDMRIKLAGIQASIKGIEEKLGNRQKIQLNNASIIEKRNQLGTINAKIEAIEIVGLKDTINVQSIIELKSRAEKLKEELQSAVNDLYNYTSNTEGIPISTLLNDWLKNVVDYESTKAGLDVLGERIIEFQKQYDIYAPAGANIKRIEREISVSEQEYLQLLNGLNLAKLKVQDAELSSSIKAVDPPYFPLSPNPTKRKILVLVAAVLGFVVVLVTILAMEYFDDTMRDIENASKIIQIKTIGIFPKILFKTGSLNFAFVTNRMLEMIIQQVDLLTLDNANLNRPRTLLFISSSNDEGKTILAGNIARKLKMSGRKVLFLNFTKDSLSQTQMSQNNDHIDNKSVSKVSSIPAKKHHQWLNLILGYNDNRIDFSSPFLQNPDNYLDNKEYIQLNVDSDSFSLHSFENLVENYSRASGFNPDYIFIEIPPILYYPYPQQLVASADLTILVCRANRIWSGADQKGLDVIKKISSREPVLLLNGVELQVIESVLGDLPKKRSRVRRILKQIVRFQFFTHDHL